MDIEKKSFLQKIPGFRSGVFWKKVVASWAYAVVVMIIVIAIIDPSSEESPPPAKQAQQAQRPQAASAEQKDAFALFYERVMDLCNRSDEINETLVNSGQSNVHELYGLVSTAKDNSENIYTTMRGIEVPGSLSKEHQKQLKEVKSDLGTAIFCRIQAYEAYMEYLDTRRPSDSNEMKENIEASSFYLMSGVAKLVTVKADLGIED